MTGAVENIAEKLFKVIKGFGHTIVLFTDEGKKTIDPTEARRFFATDLQMMVNLIVDETSKEVAVNLSKDTEISEIKPMLNSIRKLANQYILNYTVKTFGKTIGPKDFSFMAKQKTNEAREMTRAAIMKKINDGEWEATQDVKPGRHCEIRNVDSGKRMQIMVKESKPVMQGSPEHLKKLQAKLKNSKPGSPEYSQIKHAIESMFGREHIHEGFSGWHGSAMKSINELGDARLIVRHKRSVDEEKRGARTRQIESIFIENNEGERFKFPSNNITAAKAMVRHVKEGGTPYDDFGQYIYETMEELNQLKVFQRKNRRNDFFEDANINEEIGGRINQLRGNLKQISGVKGYAHHFENFTRESADVDKEKLDELKDSVTITYFDEAISDSLPYVARVIENMRGRQAREADIMDLAKYVMDNKDNIELNSELDETDPESPGNRKFRDPATAFAAWVTYIQSKIKDDVLANKLMQAADVIHEVGPQHVKMAAAALKVVRQNAQVSETQDLKSDDDNVYKREIDNINETMSRFSDTRHLFGA